MQYVTNVALAYSSVLLSLLVLFSACLILASILVMISILIITMMIIVLVIFKTAMSCIIRKYCCDDSRAWGPALRKPCAGGGEEEGAGGSLRKDRFATQGLGVRGLGFRV